MIKLGCEKCGHVLHLKDEMAGKKGRCPRCGTSLVIPGGSRMSATSSLSADGSARGGLLPANESAAPQGADEAGAHKGRANRQLATPTSEPSCLHPAAIVVIAVAIVVVSEIQGSTQTRAQTMANMLVLAVANIVTGLFEGVVTGYIVSFLGKVRPDLIGETAPARIEVVENRTEVAADV